MTISHFHEGEKLSASHLNQIVDALNASGEGGASAYQKGAHSKRPIHYAIAQLYAGETGSRSWAATADDGIAEVKVLACSQDGTAAAMEVFSVYCYHSVAVDPNIHPDDIILYTLAEDNRWVTVGTYTDGKIGDVKMWGQIETNIPAGWEIFSDISGKFPIGAETGEFIDLGSTGGTIQHAHLLSAMAPATANILDVTDSAMGVALGGDYPPYFGIFFIERTH